MDLPEDFLEHPMCSLEPDVILVRTFSPEAFFLETQSMKGMHFCTVVPDDFGTNVYYISVEEIFKILSFVIFIAVIWRLMEMFQSCVYRICCKK